MTKLFTFNTDTFRLALLPVFIILILLVGMPAIVPAAAPPDDPAAAAGEEATAARAETIESLFDKSWQYLGQMHEDEAALDKAMALLEQAKELDPDNEDVYWKLAEITFKKAEVTDNEKDRRDLFEKAIDLAQEALAINPDSLGGFYWEGCANAKLAEMAGPLSFSALGQVKQAKKDLHTVIELDPDHRYAVLARAILAAIYTEAPWPLKDLDQAEELATTAVAMDPDLTLASRFLARVYRAQGENEKARQELRRGLAIADPTYIWDSVLFDWPDMREMLEGLEK